MKVRGQNLVLDIRSELDPFDWFRAKWSDEKLIACSPFRSEHTPSFAVSLETGVWVDSGGDDEWYKGNFVKLLSFLRNETYEETEEYLLDMYGGNKEVDRLLLNVNFQLINKTTKFFDAAAIKPFAFKHPYLTGRGIPEKVQRAVKIGYDRQRQAIVIPWFDRQGRIVNMKFRSVNDKRFWYASGGQPIRNHLYLIDLVYRLNKTLVYIVESEIDALTRWAAGHAAIALGGAFLTERQRDIIIQSPIEILAIATDNDRAGQRIKYSIFEQLSGFMLIEELIFPPNRKDVNEFSPEELERLTSNSVL